MNYQLTLSENVLRLDDGANIPPDPANSDYQAYLSWVAAGNTADPVPVPGILSVAASMELAVQAWIDATAQGNGYADANTCVSYFNSSNALWSADAQAMVAWRDLVWAACYAMEQGMLTAPPNPLPTAAQVIAQAFPDAGQLA